MVQAVPYRRSQNCKRSVDQVSSGCGQTTRPFAMIAILGTAEPL
jgi:hypothetical protein